MSKSAIATAQAETDVQVEQHQEARNRKDTRRKKQPRYNVILWDDDDHSYEYVIRMMRDLFGHPSERGYQLAVEVDTSGRVICLTTTLEHAELKRDQVHSFGKDRLVTSCAGAMSCTLEPVD